ncbi:hypothetical protein BVC80_8973g23 [Macleaya cordata]|uniref:Uncharacterized protein n=1 Tax=Macleaya cordata TaxID=56857 RepID=A0A200PMR5_MACCD|nr:hypothetical protein BVC80_8973g23 [Macleaya cordata]
MTTRLTLLLHPLSPSCPLLRFSSNHLSLSSSPTLSLFRRRRFCTKMAASKASVALTHTIILPSDRGGGGGGVPVEIVAAPGLSDSDFRQVIDLL